MDSLARPDLVLQLRAMDIGKSGMPALVSSISALSSTITALTVEMVSLREDRDREVREMKATIDGLVAKMIHLEEGGSPNLIAQSTTPSTTYSSVASSGSTGAGVRETVTRTPPPPNAHSTNRTRTSQTSTHVHQTSSRTETPPAAPTRSTLATTSTSEYTGRVQTVPLQSPPATSVTSERNGVAMRSESVKSSMAPSAPSFSPHLEAWGSQRHRYTSALLTCYRKSARTPTPG